GYPVLVIFFFTSSMEALHQPEVPFSPRDFAYSSNASSFRKFTSSFVGSLIPSKVSKRYILRELSLNLLRLRAASMELPPFQTPHSTISPGMLFLTMYWMALYSAYILSGEVMV